MRTKFKRNGHAWCVNADGNFGIDGVSADIIRKDHQLGNGKFLGLLIEQQSTNDFLFSRDFSNIWQVRDNALLTSNAGLSPANQMDAAILDVSNDRNSRVFQEIQAGLRTFSIFASNTADYQFRAVTPGSSQSEPITTSDFVRVSITGEARYYYLADRRASNFAATAVIWGAQAERGPVATTYIPTNESVTTRPADFFDAPAGAWLPTGRHTWRGLVRMSADPREPTILGHPDGRIYAQDGRLHLDGPGMLWQPDGEHAPGGLVPFYWQTEFSGAPDFTLGRAFGDADWWNSHLVDIVPYPRVISETDIREALGI